MRFGNATSVLVLVTSAFGSCASLHDVASGVGGLDAGPRLVKGCSGELLGVVFEGGVTGEHAKSVCDVATQASLEVVSSHLGPGFLEDRSPD